MAIVPVEVTAKIRAPIWSLLESLNKLYSKRTVVAFHGPNASEDPLVSKFAAKIVWKI